MNIDIAKLGYRWKGVYSQYLAYTDNDVVYLNGGAYVIKNGLPVAFALGQQMATGVGQVLTGNVAVSGVPDTALHSNGADSLEFRFMGGRNGVIATTLMTTDRMECSGNNLSNNYMSAMMSDGSVRVWGLRSNGQTGTGLYGAEDYSLPTRVAFPPGTPRIKQVVSNWNDTYFLDANGAVWHCGANRGDYMSGRNTSGATGIPTKINGFGDLGANTVITKIFQSNGYAASPSMFLLDNLGRVYCWGYNGYGNLGNGTANNILAPYLVPFTATTPIKDIYATGRYSASFLISTAGIMYTAGETNTSLYTGTNREFRPVMPWGFNKTVKQVFGCETYYLYDPGDGSQAAGAIRRYGAVLDNGEMWCWGDAGGNYNDGFGIAYTTAAYQGNAIYPIKVLDGVAFGQANAGWNTMLALMTDGTVKWTGYNGQGVGGALANRQTWITIGDAFLTGVTKLRMYGYGSYSTAVALRSDGKVVVWGYGGNGQVGDGYNTAINYPNKYLLIDKTVVDFEAGTNFGAGGGSLYCLTSDGQVMMTGLGSYSTSGDPAANSRFAPAPIIF